jgi:hypothetical protein
MTQPRAKSAGFSTAAAPPEHLGGRVLVSSVDVFTISTFVLTCWLEAAEWCTLRPGEPNIRLVGGEIAREPDHANQRDRARRRWNTAGVS